MLAEQGMIVTRESIRHWCLNSGAFVRTNTEAKASVLWGYLLPTRGEYVFVDISTRKVVDIHQAL
jgi:hypothetical protein